MRSFLSFLDNWGIKYCWISLKFGMEVVDKSFYDIYSGFSNKKGFCEGFPKISVFRVFLG